MSNGGCADPIIPQHVDAHFLFFLSFELGATQTPPVGLRLQANYIIVGGIVE